MIALAPSWGWIVAANVLLGVNQGLAWSMTVVMKIDLVGPRRRGLALGLNESAGYLGVAAAAFATGALAASYAPRTVVWVGAALIAAAGLAVSVLFVRDTAAHVALEQRDHGAARPRCPFAPPSPRRACATRCCAPARRPASSTTSTTRSPGGSCPSTSPPTARACGEIGIVAALYPAVWGAGQVATGWLSDHIGRKPLIVAGMLVQAAALGLLVAGGGAFAPALAAAVLLGVGTAMVYPTLIAAVSDVVTAGRARPGRRRLPLLARLRLRASARSSPASPPTPSAPAPPSSSSRSSPARAARGSRRPPGLPASHLARRPSRGERSGAPAS